MPVVPDAAYFELAPDWVCEVLSPSTHRFDRLEKLPAYGRHGVAFAWLVHPRMRSLESFELVGGRWVVVAPLVDDARDRVPPFDAVELDLGALWADVPVPLPRAAESRASYAYDGEW
jgi:Uma2 family endonuclease